MTQIFCEIIKKEEIAFNIFSMWLKTDCENQYGKKIENLKSGQFLHILPQGKTLRRPISICEIGENSLRIVFEIRGEGTADIASMNEGDILDVLAPCGNGFPIEKAEKVLIVGGGIGVPPLLELSKYFPNADIVLGFRDKEHIILENEFKNPDIQTGAIINLPDKDYDLVYTCGAIPMMKAVAAKYKKVYVSLEERMGCGVGACLGCPVKTTDGIKRVCKDGPVFNAAESLWS
ncbi:MAG: dihydroorotate dehydrogenase electron transfer subunit [Oscillospiraceae bacterium]|jgi:dihydroorotate dehydrogenase electron transfer subunit|nr:dihydroorotate dehydrogenase electron transfer subunit [Oscillospiraceae bacterium]